MSSTPLNLIREIYKSMFNCIINEQYDKLPGLAAQYRVYAAEVIQNEGVEPLGSPGVSLWHLVNTISDLGGTVVSHHLRKGGDYIISTLPVSAGLLMDACDIDTLDKKLAVDRYVLSNKSFMVDSYFLRMLNKVAKVYSSGAEKIAAHFLAETDDLMSALRVRQNVVSFLSFAAGLPSGLSGLKDHKYALRSILEDKETRVYLDTIVALKKSGCDKLAKEFFIPDRLNFKVGREFSDEESIQIQYIVENIGISPSFKQRSADHMDNSGLFFIFYEHICKPYDACESYMESSGFINVGDYPYLLGAAIRHAQGVGAKVDNDAVVGLLNLYCKLSNYDLRDQSKLWPIPGNYLAQVKELSDMRGDYLERDLGL